MSTTTPSPSALFEPDPNPDRLITASEIMTRIGCSRRSLWRWVETRGFPRPRIAIGLRYRRWRAGDIDAWLAENANNLFE
jgi:predicted DNA-binding transcriptional regulator AlpA